VLLLLGLQYGIPLLLQAIRQFRKGRGDTLLTEDQFQQLLDQYKQLLKLMEQNAKTPPNINT
jgi:ribosomal protein S15P/S13E